MKGPLNALADSIHKLQCLNDTHLLLGLLGERESLAAKALEMSGISAENIRNVAGTGIREKPVAARTLMER